MGGRPKLPAASGGVRARRHTRACVIAGTPGPGAAVAGAALLRRPLESQLYGVSALDPLVVALVAAVLLVVALLACIIPARRAAHTDPTVALAE